MRHERYEPNRMLKKGIKAWGPMVVELWEARELASRLFMRNLAARYKQAFLGFLWAVIVPFVAIGTFIFLNRMGIVNIGKTDVPYPLFALLGLSAYQLFSTGITASCGALVEAGDMIAKVNFPREVLVIAAIAQAVFELLIKMALIAAVCIYYQYLPPVMALMAVAALLPLLVLTMGLGLILSLANAVVRDTAQAVGILMTFLMFLTPVLYPAVGPRAFWLRVNPLTALIEGPRDLFIYGSLRHPTAFWVVSSAALLILLCAWRVFHLVETKVPERL
ncbi:MAG: ABC transporter permease [Candidatus Omnitrophica bacterium]|nr:ABC transporter permease [Candidatus Omnitrophota bacterium]